MWDDGSDRMTVKVTIEDGIGTLVMSLPPLNILTREALGHIRERLAELADEATLRVVLFRAEGKHFSAGADVGEHMSPQYEQMIPEFMQTIAALRDFPVPIVAAVQGRCLGGGFELAQGADLIVAGEGATFGQPEILLGVTAPAASVLLPMLGPTAVAAEILFTGDAISAADAHRAGLVARVVPDDRIDAAALELCRRIARHSAAALRSAKRMLRIGEHASRAAAFGSAERMYVEDLMQTRDAVEGLTAFLEKRKPAWSHR
jgi:cyclohexa-1,5-dienecarbonyl-CoA hydratase